MLQPRYDDYDHGITAIDTDYVRPYLDASHLIVRDGRAAFVDTGVNSSVPHLLAVLERKGIAPDQVDYVLVTHVHLDHAGGAGQLMQALPNARLVVHPRGARHMIDPQRLIEGSIAVYGAEAFKSMFGEIRPVPAERVIAISDGEELKLGNSRLLFIHTPGHAAHHYCIVDYDSNSVFTGDTFGVSYRELDSAKGPIAFVTSTPVQFDPDALHASIDRLLGFEPQAAYLTHYSRVEDLPRLAAELHQDIDAYVAIARRAQGTDNPAERIGAGLREYMLGRLEAHGCPLEPDRAAQFLAVDITLNTQGLLVWLARQ
ncbi:MAG: MBL fold metallo-hydrolase [Xanthomonadaceae bacterium]|nr:MBL fold metallo-hydrolase [Xanthomonadaceae bacterium]